LIALKPTGDIEMSLIFITVSLSAFLLIGVASFGTNDSEPPDKDKGVSSRVPVGPLPNKGGLEAEAEIDLTGYSRIP
jgi:hypothetical protein